MQGQSRSWNSFKDAPDRGHLDIVSAEIAKVEQERMLL
jgi:hypothetical protein